MKSWLQKNGIAMYETHKEGTSGVAEQFIRTLKNKMHKYKTWVSKNVHIDQIDNI